MIHSTMSEMLMRIVPYQLSGRFPFVGWQAHRLSALPRRRPVFSGKTAPQAEDGGSSASALSALRAEPGIEPGDRSLIAPEGRRCDQDPEPAGLFTRHSDG